MLVPEIHIVSSLFTRSEGYTDITSNLRYKYHKATDVLNSFTPQGASPQISLRLAWYDNLVGTGFFHMEDSSNARISVTLIKYSDEFSYISIPTKEEQIFDLVNRKMIMYKNRNDITSLNNFGYNELASIIFSLISGDNIIVIHPDHETRLCFFNAILQIFPILVLKYNRVTTNCTELLGNKNVIGVPTLPEKYRDHKKLHLSYDTIFVNLSDHSVTGGGVKINDITLEIAQTLPNLDATRNAIKNLLDKVSTPGDVDKLDRNYHLINKAKIALGYDIEPTKDWFMSF